jgi:hypothetical protein
MAEGEQAHAVFASVHFQIIISDGLPAWKAEEVSLDNSI